MDSDWLVHECWRLILAGAGLGIALVANIGWMAAEMRSAGFSEADLLLALRWLLGMWGVARCAEWLLSWMFRWVKGKKHRAAPKVQVASRSRIGSVGS